MTAATLRASSVATRAGWPPHTGGRSLTPLQRGRRRTSSRSPRQPAGRRGDRGDPATAGRERRDAAGQRQPLGGAHHLPGAASPEWLTRQARPVLKAKSRHSLHCGAKDGHPDRRAAIGIPARRRRRRGQRQPRMPSRWRRTALAARAATRARRARRCRPARRRCRSPAAGPVSADAAPAAAADGGEHSGQLTPGGRADQTRVRGQQPGAHAHRRRGLGDPQHVQEPFRPAELGDQETGAAERRCRRRQAARAGQPGPAGSRRRGTHHRGGAGQPAEEQVGRQVRFLPPRHLEDRPAVVRLELRRRDLQLLGHGAVAVMGAVRRTPPRRPPP